MSNIEQEPSNTKDALKISEKIDHPVHGISLLLTPYTKLDKILIMNRAMYYVLKSNNIGANSSGMIEAACNLTTPPNQLVDTPLTKIIKNNFTLENERSIEELICHILEDLTFDEIMNEVTGLMLALFVVPEKSNIEFFETYVKILREYVTKGLKKRSDVSNLDLKSSIKEKIGIIEENVKKESVFIVSENAEGKMSPINFEDLKPEQVVNLTEGLCNYLYKILLTQDIALRKAVLNELNLRLSTSHVDNQSAAIN